jgi:hypothetical protein
MKSFACLIAASALFGCAMNDPNAMFSAVRAYPMGTGQYMITCVDSPSFCASEAVNRCPSGFNVTSNTTNPADHGRMTMIIRCN